MKSKEWIAVIAVVVIVAVIASLITGSLTGNSIAVNRVVNGSYAVYTVPETYNKAEVYNRTQIDAKIAQLSSYQYTNKTGYSINGTRGQVVGGTATCPAGTVAVQGNCKSGAFSANKMALVSSGLSKNNYYLCNYNLLDYGMAQFEVEVYCR